MLISTSICLFKASSGEALDDSVLEIIPIYLILGSSSW